jgi:mannose-6-phosphate isomerase-like protein (cupin superfamily)
MQARVISADAGSEYLTEERCHILELANSEDDADVSIARARVEPGVTTRKHSVAGTAERYVVLEGQGEVHIAGLPDQSVVPGDVVLIPPGVAQSISNIGTDQLVFLCVCTPRFDWGNYQSLD